MAWTVTAHKRIKYDIIRYSIPPQVVSTIIKTLESLHHPKCGEEVTEVKCTNGKLWRVKPLRAHRWRGLYVIRHQQHLIVIVAIRPRDANTYNERELEAICQIVKA